VIFQTNHPVLWVFVLRVGWVSMGEGKEIRYVFCVVVCFASMSGYWQLKARAHSVPRLPANWLMAGTQTEKEREQEVSEKSHKLISSAKSGTIKIKKSFKLIK